MGYGFSVSGANTEWKISFKISFHPVLQLTSAI